MDKSVVLRKNRDKAIKNRHHWIFSGAVKSMPEFEDGSILPVKSFEGEFLGTAYFNRKCSIIGRMVSFDETPPLKAIEQNIERAVAYRGVYLKDKTNAYRLVNGEGDMLPGLVVDRYADVLVIQITTLGMERLKPFIIEILLKNLRPQTIYEKSNLPARHEEGLGDFEDFLYGKKIEVVEILENGMSFLVDIVHSQKTGFFLDQREMRQLVRSLSKDRRVLNCFAYTGGFTVSALKGGAQQVDSVDTSERAMELARENVKLNRLKVKGNGFYIKDVFTFLRECGSSYDFIILDPPAFAKKKADVVQACRGYKDINRLAMQKALPRSLLLTFSCSFFVDEPLFQTVVFQAAQEAGRNARIIQKHHLAYDHPVNIYHPESDYLKGFLLYLD